MLFGVASFLFLASLVLAVVAALPERLWDIAVRLVNPIGPVLALLAWLIFSGSWLAIIDELPGEVWWAHVLAWGGVPMFLYLFARFFYQLFRAGILPPGGWTPRRPTEGD